MNLQNIVLDPNNPNFFYALGGVILIVYVLFTRRRLNKLKNRIPGNDKESAGSETDVLGMEKPIPKGIEHFTSLDKVMQWKTILLIVLMIIGLYLVFTQGPSMRNESGPVESVLEQGSEE